jgi:hypothetical protein
MSKDSQYGNTLFLKNFEANPSAQAMERLSFSKNLTESAPYNEAWLQNLIMSQPSLLPVGQIEPSFADLVPVCIELQIGSNFIDNLLVTPNGNIALIECKLWRNPEARRKVVTQIIDYAKQMSSLTYAELQEAISRTRPLNASDENRTRRLYEIVSPNGETDEASFHDAVSRNLKRGRFLLLIVGDGIQEGVESLTEFLQQYAGIHFTLAIVEVALFKVPTGGYVAQPRVLAKTTNIIRGIVTMDEGRIAIKPPSVGPGVAEASAKRTTITQEGYFEQLEKNIPGVSTKLNALIDDLAGYNVSPEFGTISMTLRWRSDDTGSWNLGSITTSGQVWMDYLGQQAKNAGLLEVSKQYLENLARLVPDAYVKKTAKETGWYVAWGGKTIQVDALLADGARKEGWVRAISEFQAAVTKSSQGN